MLLIEMTFRQKVSKFGLFQEIFLVFSLVFIGKKKPEVNSLPHSCSLLLSSPGRSEKYHKVGHQTLASERKFSITFRSNRKIEQEFVDSF